MTLLVAYTAWRDRTPGLRAGQAFKRAADANVLPVGTAHAVEEGDDVALCGAYVELHPNPGRWPLTGIGSMCPECRELTRQPAF